MDASRPWAEAVAVRSGTIVYVGDEAGLDVHRGPRTRVVDVGGRLVLPGFQDCHVHPGMGGVNRLACNLEGLWTPQDYVRAVSAYAKAHPDRPWIRGGGWSMTAFLPDGIPDKGLLDDVVPNRPVFLLSLDGHSAWVNSRALALARISKETPDPPGGRIDRDPGTGEPLGGLQEMSAMDIVQAAMPPLSDAEIADGLRHALSMLNGYGITSFQDALVTLDGPTAYRSLDAYRQLDASDALTARVVASLFWDASKGEEQIPRFMEARRSYTGGRLRVSTVKIWQDGVLETHTAKLLDDYADRPGHRGRSHVDPDALKRLVARLDEEGFQIHFHAIGDAAVRECLDAIEEARDARPEGGRHHIAHLQVLHPDDLPRFRRLEVAATFQPLWACRDPQLVHLTFPLLGDDRNERLYLIRSVLAAGAAVAFGSDWPVSTANPFEQIQVALTRTCVGEPNGTPLIADEGIDLMEALASFTIRAAYVNGHEDRTGSIETGKFADLIVLDRDLFDIEPHDIAQARVVLTLLEGRPVFGDFAGLESVRPHP